MQFPESIQPGQILDDRFEIVEEAATGGMATVYRAHDRVTGEAVALKVFAAHKKWEATRFQQEAQMLAELSHPGIVRYLTHGEGPDGEQYLAMEWLEGEDLS